MQFVTGRRTRPFDEQTIANAKKIWEEWRSNNSGAAVSAKHASQISNIVFQHKSILLDNKTLPDTVKPAEEWTLKAGKKTLGCACCGPDDESSDEEEEGNNLGLAISAEDDDSAFLGRGWKDGKTAFAFDPSVFN